MADTGKQSPLGVNVTGSILDNIGFWINPTAESYMGSNKLTWTEVPGSAADYAKTSNNLLFGKTVEETALKWVTWSINDAFFRGAASKPNPLLSTGTVTSTTYNNLLSIGQNATTGGTYFAALGNSPPVNNWTNQNVNTWDPTYTWKNPHPELYPHGLAGPPAFSGYGLFSWTHPVYEGAYPVSSPFDPPTRVKYAYINEGQLASWWPFKATAPSGSSAPAGSTSTTTTTSSGGAPNTSGGPTLTATPCTPGPVDVYWDVTPGVFNSPGENTQNPNRAVLVGPPGTVFSIRVPPMTSYTGGGGYNNEDGTERPVIFSLSTCGRPGYPAACYEWCISECKGDFANPIYAPPAGNRDGSSNNSKAVGGGCEYGSISIAYDPRLTQSRNWYIPGNPNKTYYVNIRYIGGNGDSGGPDLGLFWDLSQIYPGGVNWDAFPAAGVTADVVVPDPDSPTGGSAYTVHQGLGKVTAERNKIVAIQILPPYIRQNRPLDFQNGWCETFDFSWVISTTVGTASTAKFNLSLTPGDMTNSIYTYTGATPYVPNTTIPVTNSPVYNLCWGTPQDLSILQSGYNNGDFYTLVDAQKTCYLNIELKEPAAAQFNIINIGPEGYVGGGTNWLQPPPATVQTNPNCQSLPVEFSYEWDTDGSGIIPIPNQGWQSPTKVTLSMGIGETASFKIPAIPKFGQNNIDQLKLVVYAVPSSGPRPSSYQIAISECSGDLFTVPRGPRQNYAWNTSVTTTQDQTFLEVGYDNAIINAVASLDRSKTYYLNVRFNNGSASTLYLGVDFVVVRQTPGLPGGPGTPGATGSGPGPTGGALSPVPNRGITQWGWLRLIALQAWNEFNFNNDVKIKGYSPQRYWIQEPLANPEYRMFVDSFMSFYGFMQSTNEAIFAIQNSKSFLTGTYSNIDDLVTADLSGVSLAFKEYGQDLLNLGKIINWQYIRSFGLPSTLLKTLYDNGAINGSLNLALLAAGMPQARITAIASGSETATKEEEQKMYGSFLVVVGQDLKEILAICNCSTLGLNSLGDCLNVKKMFPNSYQTLTVPTYNTTQNAAVSAKTYYPLFQPNTANVNPTLDIPAMQEKIGTLVPLGAPPVLESLATAQTGFQQKLFSVDSLDKSVTQNRLAAVNNGVTAETLATVKNVPVTTTLLQENIDTTPAVITKTTLSTGQFLAQGFLRTNEVQNAPNIPAATPKVPASLSSETKSTSEPTKTILPGDNTSPGTGTPLGGGLLVENIGKLDDK